MPSEKRTTGDATAQQQQLWAAIERGEDPTDRPRANPDFTQFIARESEEVRYQAAVTFARERAAQLVRSYAARERNAGRVVQDGAEFVLDAPLDEPPLWGEGPRSLWQPGEGLMIGAPQGVGKSETAQQLVLRRSGMRTDSLFGLPVQVDERDGVHLYLAMDRPAQIRRSLARMVEEEDRSALKQCLRFWEGPLPINVLESPTAFIDWAEEHVAPSRLLTVIVDSYKDYAPGLSSDEVGAMVNMSMQSALARGVEWVALHHPKKPQADNKVPESLSDFYGSTWLTSGQGSVIYLSGVAGGPYVEMHHLKQPMEVVESVTIERNRTSGSATSRNPEQVVLSMVARAGQSGVTKAEVAAALFPTNGKMNGEKRAERLLHRLAETGGPLLYIEGKAGGRGGGTLARWRLSG